jgi:hypothetical protein
MLRENDHSPPSSAEVKERMELYLHSTNTSSWSGAQLKKKHRDNFTFHTNRSLVTFIKWRETGTEELIRNKLNVKAKPVMLVIRAWQVTQYMVTSHCHDPLAYRKDDYKWYERFLSINLCNHSHDSWSPYFKSVMSRHGQRNGRSGFDSGHHHHPKSRTWNWLFPWN